MDDLISRQAAIDAVFSLCEDCDSGYCGSCRVNYPGEKDVIKVIRNLPSAQPEILACGEGELNIHNTNVGDMISRQAVIDAFLTELTKRERKNLLHTWSTVEVKYFVADMLEKIPSVQPEQKIGKWIYDGTKRICPFCKDFIVTGRSIVKYCWNCGARLKERSEE